MQQCITQLNEGHDTSRALTFPSACRSACMQRDRKAELFARWSWLAEMVTCCQSRIHPKSAERQEYEDLRVQLVRKQEEVRRLQEQCAQLDALRQPAAAPTSEPEQPSSSQREAGRACPTPEQQEEACRG